MAPLMWVTIDRLTDCQSEARKVQGLYIGGDARLVRCHMKPRFEGVLERS